MTGYRGRFAPSPTGPLHFGSLVAAAGSFLEARSHGGEWLVRIEDLDPPREIPGAADAILRTLESLGLHWDGEVLYQSRRSDAYRAALATLEERGWIYACACSRREITAKARRGPLGAVYPGTCRGGIPAGSAPRALRVRTEDAWHTFHDDLLGPQRLNLARQVGDFVVRRADGLFAYHLATVVDDAAQGVSHVVRGADLLEATFCHLHLQHLLDLLRPRYLHLPVAVNHEGGKLSKQTRARPVDRSRPVPILVEVLHFLGQEPPDELLSASLDEAWAWAYAHWSSARIPRQRRKTAPPALM